MIKVLNIISDKNIGGAGRCVLNFLKYYDRDNFQVSVVVPKGSLLKPEIEKLNTQVIEVSGIADKSFDTKCIGELKRIIKEENPDAVHTHGTFSGRIAGKLCGKKIIYTRHSVFPVSKKISTQPGKTINKLANEFFSDEIIAVAEAAKDNLTEGGISDKKIKVILNGVEPVKRCTDEEIKATKEKYGIKDDEFVIGIMARLEAVKGHRYLIDAGRILKNKGKKVKILIIGTGGIENEIRDYVNKTNMNDTVVFTGFIKNVREILSIMDIQANASYGTEATSLALLEGMSMGIPAVVSNYGGNPGVITSGENGYIFKLKDSEDMALYIEKIMDNPDIFEYMKEKSKEIFNNKFTAQIYARNIENIYRDAVK